MEVVLQPRRRVCIDMFTKITQMPILPNNYGEQLWRTTMHFAFLDHVNNELEHRVPGDQRQMMSVSDTQHVRSLGGFGE